MREIKAVEITRVVMELVKRANFSLRKDVLFALRKSYRGEKNRRAKTILGAILDNAAYAQKENLAICQDTGMPIVFVQIGQDLKISGNLNKLSQSTYQKLNNFLIEINSNIIKIKENLFIRKFE